MSDAARHEPECEMRLEINKQHEEYRKKEEALEFSKKTTRFASEDPDGNTAQFVSNVGGANTFEA